MLAVMVDVVGTHEDVLGRIEVGGEVGMLAGSIAAGLVGRTVVSGEIGSDESTLGRGAGEEADGRILLLSCCKVDIGCIGALVSTAAGGIL